MRRLTLFIYSALVMLVGALVLGTTPSVAQVTVDLPEVTARVGTSGTIPITVGDLTGEGVISYEFTISYDESIVDLTGVSTEGTLSAGATPTVNTATPGELRVSFAQASALSGSGTLININASFESEGTSPLTFDNFLFNEDPAGAATPGSVTVAERAVFFDDNLTAFVGQEDVLIPVSVDALTAADDIVSFEFNVTYDPSVLDITGATTSGSLSEGFSVVTNDISASEIRVVAAGANAIEGEGTLIYLVADPVGAGTSDLTVTNLQFNEGAPVLASIAGSITVSGGEPFEANLAGYNEVEPVDTDASGSVSATLSGDQLVLTGAFSGLSAAYTASHIHVASAGDVGTNVITLVPTLDADGMGGSYEASRNTFTLVDSLITALQAGRLYVNVHSTENPGGEIRGQLLDAPNAAPTAVSFTSPEDGEVIVVEGDPMQEITFSWTTATDPDGDEVYYVLQEALSSDFSDADAGETVEGNSEVLTFAEVNALLADLGVGIGESVTFYLRINSQDGSLRTVGPTTAVTLVRGVLPSFQANLTSVNEVPPVESPASGTVLVSLSGRELIVTGFFDNLSADFAASHIHLGAVGDVGDIVIPLVVSTSDDARSGSYGANENTYDLDARTYPPGVDADDVIAAIENGGAYVNVHSTAYPGGEIRGQVLSIGNDAPAASGITTPGVGAEVTIAGDPGSIGLTVGFESVDDPNGDAVAYIYQLATGANFENVVFTEMQTEPTGIEFSIDDLADVFDQIAEEIEIGARIRVFHRVVTTDGSLWTAGDESAIVLIRGEVTGVDDPDALPQEFTLRGNYPNPFNPSTTVSFDLPESAEITIKVIDALGREVMSVPTQAVQAGANRVLAIDASTLASGTYMYRVIAKGATSTMVDTGTMTIVK